MLGAMRTVPLEGDIYLLWSPARKEFVRSGIIVTIEHIEKVSDGSMGYRFIRWTAMDGRDENQKAINIAIDAASFRKAA